MNEKGRTLPPHVQMFKLESLKPTIIRLPNTARRSNLHELLFHLSNRMENWNVASPAPKKCAP